MQINLDIDLTHDAEAIRAHIIDAAAKYLLVQTTPYNDDPHFTKLANSLRDDIARVVRAEVEKIVAPAVATALEAGVQRTDNYGSPAGPKVPLRQVIVEEAEKALNKRVEVRDNYSRSESVVQQVIRDEVQRVLADDLKAVVKAEREKVTKAVRDEAATIITDAVRRATASVGR
jgi:hypothetical protein